MPTFRMNPNLELQEFTQPLLKKKRVYPASVTSIITYYKGKKCGDYGRKDF
ncbi:unnamed protein product [Brassica rapa]|uniref:Uncharacterized protein n=1 Tax=Brassica campestris TaxID=3711 RepID=A0A8D9GEP8_BRACM|nr:unnamed protein product [Brassica rapa]